MGYYSDLYKKTERSKGEALAFDVLVSDLMVKNKTGVDKQRDLDSRDMESVYTKAFIPSMFYIFMYARDQKTDFAGNSFYDACPMILCTGVDSKTVSGINFNLIPNNIRAVILDILRGDFKGFFDDVDRGNSVSGINERFGSTLISGNGLENVIKYLKMRTDIDFTSCIRKYSMKNIIKVRMIEYDQWKYIPFLTFKDAVRGVNLAKLQSDFVESQNK